MANAKKDSTKKKTGSSSPSPHLPYHQMITEAITTMKDRTGSSQPAIAKFMEENYAAQLPPNFKKILSIQLKKFVKSEKLVKVKNSYKIPAADKAKKPAVAAVEKKQPPKKEPVKAKEKETAKKVVEKAKRTKRLSQVKTPEAMKKTAAKAGVEKMKKKAATPAKRKIGGSIGTTPPAKKAKK